MRFSKYPTRAAQTFHLWRQGDEYHIPAALLFRFLAAALIASAFLPTLASETGSIRGSVFTLDSNRNHTGCPNARVTFRNLSTKAETSTVSNDLGEYWFTGAYGDLNDYNQFFGNFSYPLVRPNPYGPLSSDDPNRGLFWAIIGLPHKFDFVPILDVHTGFPLSWLDQNWNYLGSENQAGLFPTFLALDTKGQYPWISGSTGIASNSVRA